MNDYRYLLDKSSRKFVCPDCNRKRFVKYIDTETGLYLPDQYGRCDKGDGHYFLNPYSDGYARNVEEQKTGNATNFISSSRPHRKPQPQPEPVYFDFETFKKTLQPERYKKNTFIQNLLHKVAHPFNAKDVTKVIELYRLGTVAKGDWMGAITLPYIDIRDNVRTIQVKRFDNENHTTRTGKLDKVILSGLKMENRTPPGWLTSYIEYGDSQGYFTCLFGEHLLSRYPKNPVALVEAPKTAIYGTLYIGLPKTDKDLLWLAVYNKSSFSFEKTKVLDTRNVIVFPDLSEDGSTFKEWDTKAKEYQKKIPKARFYTSDFLEQLATKEDRAAGSDLADILIKNDWRKYRKNIRKEPQAPTSIEGTRITEATSSSTVEKSVFSHRVNENDGSFKLEAHKDYTRAQILQAIADIQPEKDSKALLAEMISDNRLHWCSTTEVIYYIPF
ncbi:DUF6371 domain-containing protein [Geofilum rubicundum]|uniref:Uncharacterized protein n=1 Tax=Geofilum rubicundum JCM 15548 TaxID=1236989 RepID=A0A0E9LSQ5_9BACT|nr:DUF6371 domain-containing protein [Geofilum rubicundum]GAO28328.1 hypothetical protein JCM15548_1408 [Geofilum rubicundum JCM 15548]